MIYERKRDPEGHLRIVEGVDYVYTVVALTIGHFSKKTGRRRKSYNQNTLH